MGTIDEALDGIVQHVARVVKERDQLRERFDAEHETLARVVKERNDLHVEVNQLREVLHLFADKAFAYESADGQHNYLDSDTASVITVGDLRRARTVLNTSKNESKRIL